MLFYGAWQSHPALLRSYGDDRCDNRINGAVSVGTAHGLERNDPTLLTAQNYRPLSGGALLHNPTTLPLVLLVQCELTPLLLRFVKSIHVNTYGRPVMKCFTIYNRYFLHLHIYYYIYFFIPFFFFSFFFFFLAQKF